MSRTIVKSSVIITIAALFALWTQWTTVILLYEKFEIVRPFATAELFESVPSEEQQLFAVFSCSTPAINSHRGFDYAFYLPLTTLARGNELDLKV